LVDADRKDVLVDREKRGIVGTKGSKVGPTG
jgi:hypothetical protein